MTAIELDSGPSALGRDASSGAKCAMRAVLLFSLIFCAFAAHGQAPYFTCGPNIAGVAWSEQDLSKNALANEVIFLAERFRDARVETFNRSYDGKPLSYTVYTDYKSKRKSALSDELTTLSFAVGFDFCTDDGKREPHLDVVTILAKCKGRRAESWWYITTDKKDIVPLLYQGGSIDQHMWSSSVEAVCR